MVLKQSMGFEYVRKLLKKWWVILAFIPSILRLFNFYLGFPEIILSLNISLILFSIFLTIANYLVWVEKHKENKELKIKINELENKKPKIGLSFENNKDIFILENKIFERVLEENQGIKIIDNPNILKRLGEKFLGLQNSPVVDEINESFLPLKFELHNNGEYVANDISVEIKFPKDLILIESLPANNFILPQLIEKKVSGRFFQAGNKLRLWCNKLQPPYFLEFDEVYIFSNKKEKFRVEYEIYSDELGSKGIKGELIIDAKPIKEIRKYTIKSELDRDEFEYNKLLNNQLERLKNE